MMKCKCIHWPISQLSPELAKDAPDEIPEEMEHQPRAGRDNWVRRDAVLVVDCQQVPGGARWDGHRNQKCSLHSHEGGDVAADDADHVNSQPGNQEIGGLQWERRIVTVLDKNTLFLMAAIPK